MSPEPHADDHPPELGTLDGLAYARFLTDGPPRGGILVFHGGGSSKEAHFGFARQCRAGGLAAVLFDQRGHGESTGEFGPGVLDDVAQIAGLLPKGVPRFVRGSSMGGLLSLVAAARVDARAVVAICPATPDVMARAITQRLFDARLAPGAAEVFAAMDPEAAAAALGPDLMLQHAEGDDEIPIEVSAHLHALARGSRFDRIPDGTHFSVQHDPGLQAKTLEFLLERVC